MLWLRGNGHALSGFNDIILTGVTTWQDCAYECLTFIGGKFTPPCKSFDVDISGADTCSLAQNADQHNADYIVHANFEYGEHCIGRY